jgi:hypothetical protein
MARGEMAIKREIEVEEILIWAYRDELSKRQTSSAEGIWDRIRENAQTGIDRDPGHGAAQRYAHFGLPDADAERIEKAVGALEDTVIDWPASFETIAADLSALISVNDVARRPMDAKQPKAGWGARGAKAVEAWWGQGAAEPIRDRPRDVLMVGGLRTAALVTMHAIKGTRPDWIDDDLKPQPTPAATGSNAMIVGNCEGRNRYSLGSYCPLRWSPSPMSIVSSRAEYAAWHAGLVRLADTLQLEKFTALPPKASATPWLDLEREAEAKVMPVMPDGSNDVRAWGTLPLSPARDRKAAGPVRLQRAGPVRYPLVEAQ